MHIAYIDEVKNDPTAQKYFWMCALAVPDTTLVAVENRLNAIATGFFGSAVLNKETELHASHIMHGKGACKGRALSERVELMKQLTTLISDNSDIARIQIRLDPDKMSRTDYSKIAFMYLVEKINEHMVRMKDVALLIADHDKEFANANVRSLSTFSSVRQILRVSDRKLDMARLPWDVKVLMI
jgi:hypothetical protein